MGSYCSKRWLRLYCWSHILYDALLYFADMFEFLNCELLLSLEAVCGHGWVAHVLALAVGSRCVIIHIHKLFEVTQKALVVIFLQCALNIGVKSEVLLKTVVIVFINKEWLRWCELRTALPVGLRVHVDRTLVVSFIRSLVVCHWYSLVFS